MFTSLGRALLVGSLLAAAATQVSAQGADCAGVAAKCTAACATRIMGGLNAVRQCKNGCDAELQACTQRTQQATTATAPATATPDLQAARASLAGRQLGSRTLSVGPLGATEGLRAYEVPLLDGTPLLDLTHSPYEASRIEVLRSFMQTYSQAKLDWTNGAQVNYDPKAGGDGRGLIRHWLRTSQLAADAKALESDLGYGSQGTAWRALDPEVVRAYMPCAGVLAEPGTPCSRSEASRGLTQFQGTNEFERERSRSAYMKDAAARLQKAFTPRTVSFYVLEQREVRDYDFQREVFSIRAPMTNGSAMSIPMRQDTPTISDVFGTPVQLNRLLSDELRLPKAEAESWLRKVTEHQVPGSRGRRVFALTRLDCNTASSTAQAAARCTLASATLFADPALQVRLSDL